MRQMLLFLLILCSFSVLDCEIAIKHTDDKVHMPNGRVIRIAIVDTGMNLEDRWPENSVGLPQPKICPGLSKDFTGTTLKDEHGHGTHIAGLISKYAQDANYCLVIYKYYRADSDGITNLNNTISAFKEAITQKVDVINYSGGGILRSVEECLVIKEALDNGIIVNSAAGNEGSNIDFFHFYPASCDKRVNVIGAVDKYGEKLPMSNYSSSSWNNATKIYQELGRDVLSLLPNGQYGYMSGTSQATAIFTGKLVKKMALELEK
jgi:major intracellular serine protease